MLAPNQTMPRWFAFPWPVFTTLRWAEQRQGKTLSTVGLKHACPASKWTVSRQSATPIPSSVQRERERKRKVFFGVCVFRSLYFCIFKLNVCGLKWSFFFPASLFVCFILLFHHVCFQLFWKSFLLKKTQHFRIFAAPYIKSFNMTK